MNSNNGSADPMAATTGTAKSVILRGATSALAILSGGPKPSAVKAQEYWAKQEKGTEAPSKPAPEIVKGRRRSRNGHAYFAAATLAQASV